MKTTLMKDTGSNLGASLRIALATIMLCGGLYPLVIFSFARLATPESASGSLIRDRRGTVVGSRLISQSFSKPGYFWPRPSAPKYDASAAAGSNLSPASPEVRSRAMQTIKVFGADSRHPLPADLAAASGSGLDPFITLQAALFQAPRVAAARGMTPGGVEAAIRRQSKEERIFPSGEGLVNVLVLNMELDAVQKNNIAPRQ
ncbi:potassium-transporting ATPase subunit C [Chlorobium sp. KB01]|uniref:potassium-transporting ATPase subunit C n=1 Tax=Chlorobium sp. KB01 TaxID=1917528 RepID=UPI0009776F17|nr:potassium-transporting ATPase subunit C [Chlorobium sp. KB01]